MWKLTYIVVISSWRILENGHATIKGRKNQKVILQITHVFHMCDRICIIESCHAYVVFFQSLPFLLMLKAEKVSNWAKYTLLRRKGITATHFGTCTNFDTCSFPKKMGKIKRNWCSRIPVSFCWRIQTRFTVHELYLHFRKYSLIFFS